MIQVRIDPSVAPHLRLAVVEADAVSVTDRDAALGLEIEAVTQRVRAASAGRTPAEIPGLRPARELYHRIGVDPTKLRPSSEALLRRVLRDEGLPSINSLVDLSNLCSLEFLLPIGLHDVDRLVGDEVTMRRGLPGEGYEAIGKGWYGVEGRLVAVDGQGPCGSPTSDSRRTMITLATRRCVMFIYAPAGYDAGRLAGHAAVAAERLQRFAGGVVVQARVL
ncbi:MAG: phenylalanine--tRNA ligase beta subunit-related protein [Armatimonadota bacterium]|nr:phenylalanine--tRNA ligase beta subunit-related protein [Armatimonadota bacterium]MDR7534196.1 phenylalanine--tRNA ligase beta subunit-related protein [Armatimonadota bacterium]MDR7536516.1 phenylalanine--tRNA ligase beta subunit-related protein [Armatimonadota bacterium]